MVRMAHNKGKKRVKCNHPGCQTVGYLSVMEQSNLDDDGIPWMCAPHDDRRTIRQNERALERDGEQRLAGRI